MGKGFAAARNIASRTKEIQVVKSAATTTSKPVAAKAGCVPFGCRPEGQSVKIQSGRQDSQKEMRTQILILIMEPEPVAYLVY
jgi:hypothetical protein